jgi:predicted metal-dependent hydrolase
LNYYVKNKEFGDVFVRTDRRAKRFVFRVKTDGLHVTIPLGVSEMELQRAIENVRPKLVALRVEIEEAEIIDQDYRINAEFFKAYVTQGTMNRFFAQSKLCEIKIVCPPNADFKNVDLQVWLRKVIVETMCKSAKQILPPWLSVLAKAHRFQYDQVKINSSKGRWGSCSRRKSINLSCYLILLPGYLIDYILLHELCHTIEMNHGDKFWALMNKATDGKAFGLREELKAFKIGAITSF